MRAELKEQRETIKQSLIGKISQEGVDENITSTEELCQLAQDAACSIYNSDNQHSPIFMIAKDVNLFKVCSNDEERYSALTNLSSALVLLELTGYVVEKRGYTLTRKGLKSFKE